MKLLSKSHENLGTSFIQLDGIAARWTIPHEPHDFHLVVVKRLRAVYTRLRWARPLALYAENLSIGGVFWSG